MAAHNKLQAPSLSFGHSCSNIKGAEEFHVSGSYLLVVTGWRCLSQSCLGSLAFVGALSLILIEVYRPFSPILIKVQLFSVSQYRLQLLPFNIALLFLLSFSSITTFMLLLLN